MIYIEEKQQSRQFELIDFISNLYDFKIIFWLYPESNLTSFNNLALSNNMDYKVITTYDDGFKPYGTLPLDVDKKMIKFLYENRVLIQDNVDSIALYNNGKEWYMATVGHEGMSLLNNDILLEKLKLNGFNASLETPSWW